MSNMKNKFGFTLTELMVVVLITGIMASFAIPNYTKSVERAHQTDAVTQLTTVWAANQVYLAQTGRYWPPSAGPFDVTAINTSLGLGIIPNGMTYSCAGAGASPGTFTCSAVRVAPGLNFTVRVTDGLVTASNPDPCVGGANCP